MSIVGTNDMPVVWRRVEQAAGCELARGSEETETCLCGPTLRLCPPLQIPLLLCISNLQVFELETMAYNCLSTIFQSSLQ